MTVALPGTSAQPHLAPRTLKQQKAQPGIIPSWRKAASTLISALIQLPIGATAVPLWVKCPPHPKFCTCHPPTPPGHSSAPAGSPVGVCS